MLNTLDPNMLVRDIISVTLLCCVWITRADQGKGFVIYEGKSPGSGAAAVIITSSDPISCARTCVRRTECLSFSIQDSTCNLYDTFIKDPTAQLPTQAGGSFCNINIKEKVSVTTENTDKQNAGQLNVFPQLRINKAGRVWRWQVRCGTAGVVVLAIWRGEITVSIRLIGKHSITVQDGMQNQLFTYDVPVEETVLVEPGDFVGFHYANNEPEARVRVLDADQTQEGVAIEYVYIKLIYDNELPISTILSPKAFRNRAPSLAVYIA